MLVHATDKIRTKRRVWMLASLFIAGVLLFAFSPASAQVLDSTGVMNSLLAAVSKMLLALAKICMGMTLFALKFFIELARYNGYIDAPPVIIGWVMVRDVANMFFVVVLLVIAFGTILGLEQYEWKKTLVKLIFAAVFINFSKLIAQLIIDVAHVFTMTFLNAVTATAGGNLINLFNFQGMMKMLSQDPAIAQNADLRVDIFASSVLALVFAALAMTTIGAYLVVMAARVVVLWVLIIMAPLAYILGVVPNTKSYADEYWSTFTKHVMVAPLMVFFLWLSFATLGNGNIASQINLQMADQTLANTAEGFRTTNVAAANPSVSLLEVTTWENMANFIIAIAFLLVGITAVQRLGVQGGGLVSSAVNFAKNVATYASGYALGRWAVGAGKKIGGGGAGLIGKGLYNATLSNAVERVKYWGERQVEGYRSWRAQGPRTVKKVEMQDVKQKLEEGQSLTKEEEAAGVHLDAEGYKLDKEGKIITKKQAVVSYELEAEDSRGALQKFFHGRHEKLIKSKKLLEKVQKQKGVREELMDKRVTAVPKYAMQRFEGAKEPKGGGVEGSFYNFDALDRMEQGQLEAEKARSAGKTKEFQAVGKKAVFEKERFKDGEWQHGKGTLVSMIGQHEEEAAKYEEQIKLLQGQARRSYATSDRGKQSISARLNANIQLKTAESGLKMAESITRYQFVKDALRAVRNHQTGASKDDPVLLQLAHMETEAHEADMLSSESESRVKSDTAKHMSDEALTKFEQFVRSHEEREEFLKFQELRADYMRGQMGTGPELSPENREKYEELSKKWEGKKTPDVPPPEFFNLSFQASAAKAEAVWAKDTLHRVETSLHDLTEQEKIYKKMGVPTTSSALEEFMERQKKQMNELEYHQTVAAAAGNAEAIIKRRINGEQVSLDDSMVSFAVLDHAMDQSWIDDILQRIWDQKDLKKNIADRLGWKDSDVTTDKVGQIQQLMATGWDIDFVAAQQKLNEAIDKARADGVDVLKETDKVGTVALGADWEVHKRKIKQYDQAFQKLGSYKDRAISNSHLENGGHAQYSEAIDAYMPVSASMAHEIVYSDYRKMSKSKRSDVHSHTVGSYNNKFGILTSINESNYKDAHGANLQGRDMTAVKARNLQNYMLYSSGEEIATDDNGYVTVGGKNWQDYILDVKMGRGDLLAKGKEAERAKMLELKEFKDMSRKHSAKMLAAQLRGGGMNFVMTAITNNKRLNKDLDGNARMGIINTSWEGKDYHTVTALIDDVNKEIRTEIEVEYESTNKTIPRDQYVDMEFQKRKVAQVKSLKERAIDVFGNNTKSMDEAALREMLSKPENLKQVKAMFGRDEDEPETADALETEIKSIVEALLAKNK